MYVIRVKHELYNQEFVTQLHAILAPTLTESLEDARFWLSYQECSVWLKVHSHMRMFCFAEIVHINWVIKSVQKQSEELAIDRHLS